MFTVHMTDNVTCSQKLKVVVSKSVRFYFFYFRRLTVQNIRVNEAAWPPRSQSHNTNIFIFLHLCTNTSYRN